MKYPIGIQSFDQIIENGFVYVDKTDMVHSLAHEGKACFLSRPRRFGKSLLLSTLRAYFEGKRGLFKGLKLEALENDWHSHAIFHFDFNGIDYTMPNALRAKLDGCLSRWELEYGVSPGPDFNPASRFEQIIRAAAQQSGRGVVVLVDEYDKPLLDVPGTDASLLEEHRQILKAFYGVFKLADADLRFVMLTGVTKFAQLSLESSLNQLLDISMVRRYEAICGMTEEEIDAEFGEAIGEMAKAQACGEAEVRAQLKAHCGGYHFSAGMKDICNPLSVLNAFHALDVRDRRCATGTPSWLIGLMNHWHEEIGHLAGQYYPRDAFMNCRADAAHPLPMLYQGGCLTIKDYDRRRKTFLLDFPNNEVKNGFLTLVASSC